jgi:hypothetical protein
MLKWVLYGSLLDFASSALDFLFLVIVMVVIWFEWFYSPRERALKLFFLGVSAISFVLVGYSIVTFPQSLYAGGRAWITYGRDVAYSLGGQYAIRLSDIIYFIGKTLWSTFIGSLFAVLDRYLTLGEGNKRIPIKRRDKRKVHQETVRNTG